MTSRYAGGPGRAGRRARIVLLGAACLPVASAACRAQGNATVHDLRVYGPIVRSERGAGAREGASRCIRLAVRDHGKAELLVSKLVSDFTALPTVRGREVEIGRARVTALFFDGGRRMLPVTRGNDPFVDVYCFDDHEGFERFVASGPKALEGAFRLLGRRHPYYLDRWDRHAMGFWYSANKGPWFRKDLSNEADFAFFRALDLSINAIDNFYGPAAWCRRSDVGYKINRWYDDSNYSYDACPEAASVGDPDMSELYDYYGDVTFAENPIDKMRNAEMLAYLGQFTPDEELETITLPLGERAGHVSYLGFRNRDEFARQDFIKYLRDIRKLSLAELGERWHGDPKRFAAWDEVRFPREREFYGWKDGASQTLAGGWRTKRASREEGLAAGAEKRTFDDSSWLDFETGNQTVAASRRPGWVRRRFRVEPVIAAALGRGETVYLTVCPFNFSPYANPSTAYLNGQKLGDMTLGYGFEWAQYDVTRLLDPAAENVLSVYAHKSFIGGPTFLTLRKYEPFPTSDRGLNARLFDLREWNADCGARSCLRNMEYMRGLDPDRPIKIMAYDDILDTLNPYAEEMAAYPHCTGEAAFYRPWFKRYGYLRGIPASSEPSQPCSDVSQLPALFFCMTMEGINGHDYFIHLHCITGDPAQKAWYESHVNYFKLLGRFDIRKPDIVIARSVRTTRMYKSQGDDTMYQNDPARGGIQEAHYGYAFCSERDIHDGLVDDYQVILDCNFHTLEEKDVKRLTTWVERGGTLVLNQRSGRSTFLERDSWPVARLTGCDHEIRPQTGRVTFERSPSILGAYAGRSFENKDDLYDWQKHHYFTDCVALRPRADDVEVIARYDDGAPAIVTRKAGWGRVVVLGSAFYRKSHDERGYFVPDPSQTEFYRALFKDLGVAPLVECDVDKLWAERYVSNSGTTEMLILGNKGPDAPLMNASAVWTLDFEPRRVFDPVTGLALPVEIDGSRVKIAGLNLAPWEMRYYAVERMNVDGPEALDYWLGRQRQLWRAVPDGRPVPEMDPSWPVFPAGDFLTRQFESEDEARAALAVGYEPDDKWKPMPRSDWASIGLRTGPGLWAVYRKKLDISPEWLRDLRGVRMLWHSFWFEGSVREVAVNGKIVSDDPKELLATLKEGENLLTILCASRNDGNGGFVANFGLRRIPGASGEVVDISKGWRLFRDDDDSETVDFPWRGQRLLARKRLEIPRRYEGCSVWLEVDEWRDAPGQACFVTTNGRMRYSSNNYGAKFGTWPLLVNITPDVKFGEENDIWLGGNNWHDGFRPTEGSYGRVRLFYVPRGGR